MLVSLGLRFDQRLIRNPVKADLVRARGKFLRRGTNRRFAALDLVAGLGASRPDNSLVFDVVMPSTWQRQDTYVEL